MTGDTPYLAQSTGLAAIETAHQAIAMTISFISRDYDTDRLKSTISDLMPKLINADKSLRAAIMAHQLAPPEMVSLLSGESGPTVTFGLAGADTDAVRKFCISLAGLSIPEIVTVVRLVALPPDDGRRG